jgi:hypothetical protein
MRGPVQAEGPRKAIMSQTSFLNPHPPLPGRFRFGRTGMWLSAVLVAALAAAGASALMAANPVEKAASPVPASTALRPAHVAPANQPPLMLPGFQRRGPLLTGEVTTQDGSTLRLVIDTRNHAIVGYRLVEPAIAGNSAR